MLPYPCGGSNARWPILIGEKRVVALCGVEVIDVGIEVTVLGSTVDVFRHRHRYMRIGHLNRQDFGR